MRNALITRLLSITIPAHRKELTVKSGHDDVVANVIQNLHQMPEDQRMLHGMASALDVL